VGETLTPTLYFSSRCGDANAFAINRPCCAYGWLLSRLVLVDLTAPNVPTSMFSHHCISLTFHHSCCVAHFRPVASVCFPWAFHPRILPFLPSWSFLQFAFSFFPSLRIVLTSSTAPARGYADAAAAKFSRAKPHMNIGTIGSAPLQAF
jgi:hypothetical protein